MRALLARRGPMWVPSAERLVPVRAGGWGRRPIVALLVNLPWLSTSSLQPEVAARVRGSPKSDLIPGIRVRVVGIHCIGDQHQPESVGRHAFPDLVSASRFVLVERP